MEVDGHWKHHAGLDDEADECKFEELESEAEHAGGQGAGPATEGSGESR